MKKNSPSQPEQLGSGEQTTSPIRTSETRMRSVSDGDKTGKAHIRGKKDNSDSSNESYLETQSTAGEGNKSEHMPVRVDNHPDISFLGGVELVDKEQNKPIETSDVHSPQTKLDRTAVTQTNDFKESKYPTEQDKTADTNDKETSASDDVSELYLTKQQIEKIKKQAYKEIFKIIDIRRKDLIDLKTSQREIMNMLKEGSDTMKDTFNHIQKLGFTISHLDEIKQDLEKLMEKEIIKHEK